MNINTLVIGGNLTRDVELKTLQSGTVVGEFGIALNEKRKGQNGDWIENVTFLDVTAWGKTAELTAQYLSKGSPAIIEGRLQMDSWEKDGQKRTKIKVVAEKVHFVGGKQDGERQPQRQQERPQQQTQQSSAPQELDDQIPF